MDNLIGKVIEKIEINGDRTALRLVDSAGQSYYLVTTCDCCYGGNLDLYSDSKYCSDTNFKLLRSDL